MMSSLVNARTVPTARQCAILQPIDGSAIPAPIALNRPVCVVGDRSRVHLFLPSPLVSRSHALLIEDADGLYVRDLASSNGVLVNDTRVRETLVHDGDRLKLGPFAFRCRIPRPLPDGGSEPAVAEIRGDDFQPVRLNDRRTTIIGTRGGCDVRIRGIGVSPVHAVVFRRRGRWFIRDLSSEGGTRIFGRLIREAELLGGEQIRIGTAAIWYVRPDQETSDPELSAAASAAATNLPATDPAITAVLDDVRPIVIGPGENTFSPLPTEDDRWTRSEGFEVQQATADELGLDLVGPETALASASNLQSIDPERTMMDASRSILTLADLMDGATPDELGLEDAEPEAVGDERLTLLADPTGDDDEASRERVTTGASAVRPTPDRSVRRPGRDGRPLSTDAGHGFEHELLGNPEESGALPEYSQLLGIDSALADMGLSETRPRPVAPADRRAFEEAEARRLSTQPTPLPTPVDAFESSLLEADGEAQAPTHSSRSASPTSALGQLAFVPLVPGWAKCPGCGTAFPAGLTPAYGKHSQSM